MRETTEGYCEESLTMPLEDRSQAESVIARGQYIPSFCFAVQYLLLITYSLEVL